MFARSYGLSIDRPALLQRLRTDARIPDGAYAAVIPKWIGALLADEPVAINGDGETTRDFCYVDNVVQANLLAATTTDDASVNQIYNVAVGGRTSLNALYAMLKATLAPFAPDVADRRATYRDFRAGDVRHSQADISKAERLLGYAPTHDLAAGLAAAMPWYVDHLAVGPASRPVAAESGG